MADKESWFVEDLVGCVVCDLSGAQIGKVTDIIRTGSNDVWVVQTEMEEAPEILLPALKSVIKEVDLSKRKVLVDMPKGLIDVYKKVQN